jgi:hypothetical protein
MYIAQRDSIVELEKERRIVVYKRADGNGSRNRYPAQFQEHARRWDNTTWTTELLLAGRAGCCQ